MGNEITKYLPLGISILTSGAKLIMAALVAKGMTKQQAADEIVDSIIEVVQFDDSLADRQKRRIERLNAAVPK